MLEILKRYSASAQSLPSQTLKDEIRSYAMSYITEAPQLHTSVVAGDQCLR